MPAGFNNGQVEYIKAIANVNGHKTYKAVDFNRAAEPITADGQTFLYPHLNFATADQHACYGVWTLGQKPLLRDASGNIGIPGSAWHELNAFNIPKSANSDGVVNPSHREGDEGFLESTHLNLRVVHPTFGGGTSQSWNGTLAQDHVECRMIVFRARDRQHHLATHHHDTNNFMYNLFHGNNNYNMGFNGYEEKEEIEGTLNYVNNAVPAKSGLLNIQASDAMTAPINKESWVVMKDHRFYLGREYGGKNIFETTLRWDWKDPIATTSTDITETDSEKNYCWYIMLIANNNSFNDQDYPNLNVRITGTTHMTSG